MVSAQSYASHCWTFATHHRVTRCRHPRDVLRECSSKSEVVVGVGGVGIDYLASVATFPEPDQKLRTDTLEIQGGGNCGNSMTGVSRLGLESRILSTVGTDSLGDAVVKEFEEDGVSTEFLNREEGAATPFTYIIVDESGGTRTCIHTPGAALRPEDVTPDICDRLLNDAALVYFDGRLTEAAFLVARAAKAAQIPILVEAERLRADLDMLMAEADYIVTSRHFPEDWTGEDNVGDAILATLLRLPSVKFMVTTFGKEGALLLKRVENPSGDEPEAILEDVIDDLRNRLDNMPSPAADGGEPACIAAGDIPIFPGNIVKTEQPMTLTFDRSEQKAREALSKALAASQREAAANADLDNADNYMSDSFMEDGELSDPGDSLGAAEDQTVTAEVYACSASPLSREHLVDSTGAGDAFIASILYGLVKGKSYPDILTLATVVAARKCTQLGARPGVPRRDQIAEHLL